MQIGSISSESRWKYNKIAHFHLHNSPYQFENFCQIPRTTKLQIKTTPKVSKGRVLALNKSWFKAEREPKKVYWEAQNCTARRRAPENCGCRFYMPHWTGFVVHCRKNSKESIVSSGHIGTSKTTGRLPTMLLCFILTKIQHLLGDSKLVLVKVAWKEPLVFWNSQKLFSNPWKATIFRKTLVHYCLWVSSHL